MLPVAVLLAIQSPIIPSRAKELRQIVVHNLRGVVAADVNVAVEGYGWAATLAITADVRSRLTSAGLGALGDRQAYGPRTTVHFDWDTSPVPGGMGAIVRVEMTEGGSATRAGVIPFYTTTAFEAWVYPDMAHATAVQRRAQILVAVKWFADAYREANR